MKIKVKRVLTFEYEVGVESYPGMSPEEAASYERGLDLASVAELMEYNDVSSFVIAEVES